MRRAYKVYKDFHGPQSHPVDHLASSRLFSSCWMKAEREFDLGTVFDDVFYTFPITVDNIGTRLLLELIRTCRCRRGQWPSRFI